MTMFARVLLGIFTLLTTLALAFLTGWSFFHAYIGMGIVNLLLTGGFGLFVWHDYKFFFGKK